MTNDIDARPHGIATRAMHWGVALLVVLAWLTGSTMEWFPRGAGRDAATMVHYSLGVLVLGFAALRVAWRAVSPLPPVPGQPRWQHLAAVAVHVALTVLTIALPLSGLFDRWARGRQVTVFGSLDLPAPLPIPGGRLWGEVHEVMGNLLLAVVAAHVAAALWHHVVMKDGTLRRMLPPRRPAQTLSSGSPS
ncbi:cytochrome b [Humitalea sp. 24SJ18S-53]|uniref:cytochrome b n=1 Tax=Humitalea sp. 24SJ18S-53 TaxID=3422307 RepID=UPI003D67F690